MPAALTHPAARLAAAAVAAAVLTVACGPARSGAAGPARATAASRPATAASRPATAASPSPAGAAPGCPATGAARRTITLTVRDSGRSFCVAPGTGIWVSLQGTPLSRWGPIRSATAALAPRASGRLMLALGVTGAYFVAVHPGAARLTSDRPACPQAPRPTPTGPPSATQAHCGAIETFSVTVLVRR